MRKFCVGLGLFLHSLLVFAESNECNAALKGYRVVANSRFSFSVDGKNACFFAFYTDIRDEAKFPDPNTNLEDAIWYGYYEQSNPNKIYEFPNTSWLMWISICNIDAVSFLDMNGDNKPDVTVIGSCNKNISHRSFPIVFIRRDNKYILDENSYRNLYGFHNLTVADVRAYIRDNEYIKVLRAKARSNI